MFMKTWNTYCKLDDVHLKFWLSEGGHIAYVFVTCLIPTELMHFFCVAHYLNSWSPSTYFSSNITLFFSALEWAIIERVQQWQRSMSISNQQQDQQMTRGGQMFNLKIFQRYVQIAKKIFS